MLTLSLACLLLLVTHLGVSSTPLRSWLLSTVGESIYLGGYSVLALLAIGLMIDAYISLDHNLYVWSPTPLAANLARAIMPVALVFLLSGLMCRNPTSVKMAEVVREVTGLQMPGILRITRHPVQWGILLWALAHLVANGDQASIIFFGTFAVLAALGSVALDRRRQQDPSPDWQAFYAMTSNIPFAALLAGRNRLAVSDINWTAVVVGLTFYAVLYYFHGLFSGVALV
jgi:uncharacterized membrane protein